MPLTLARNPAISKGSEIQSLRSIENPKEAQQTGMNLANQEPVICGEQGVCKRSKLAGGLQA
jgi:hypothetical protein